MNKKGPPANGRASKTILVCKYSVYLFRKVIISHIDIHICVVIMMSLLTKEIRIF